MKQFFQDYLSPLDNDFAGWSICIIAWFCLLAVICIVGYLLFLGIDFLFTVKETGTATVIGRSHSPAYVTYITTTANNVTTVMPVNHPENWSLTLQVKDLTDSWSVRPYDYYNVPNGTTYNCEYSYGRLSHSLYIRSIQ